MEKQKLIAALYKFAAQRSGIEYCNYGEIKAFRAEQRSITKDGQQAKRLIRELELHDSITAEDIIKASQDAYSGRLTITEKRIDYCAGQYFPTEYRRAVCAVAAAALWDWKRAHCLPKPTQHHNSETGEDVARYNGQRIGDYLRSSFQRDYGRGIASRWFS